MRPATYHADRLDEKRGRFFEQSASELGQVVERHRWIPRGSVVLMVGEVMASACCLDAIRSSSSRIAEHAEDERRDVDPFFVRAREAAETIEREHVALEAGFKAKPHPAAGRADVALPSAFRAVFARKPSSAATFACGRFAAPIDSHSAANETSTRAHVGAGRGTRLGDVFKRNNVAVRGASGQLVVFAHGLGCDQRVWEGVAARLTPAHRVALFDYVGSGQSDREAYDPARYASLSGYARDLTEVVDALGGPPPILVSHSISGAVGIMAAVERPALFERMVLLAPSPRYLDDPPEYVGGFRPADIAAVLDLMDRNFLGWSSSFAGFVAKEPGVVDAMTDFLSASDPRATRRFAEMTFNIDVRALLPKVTVPALIVQCRDDAVAPESVGELMHRLMPRSTYELVDVVGHCPHLSDPELIAGLVRRFIERGT